MNASDHYSIIIFMLIAVVFIIQPWLSRKNIVFGAIFPDESIWHQKETKRIIRRYLRHSVFIVLILLLAWFGSRQIIPSILAFNLVIIILLTAESLIFIFANHQIRRFKQHLNTEARLTDKIIVETGKKEVLLPLSWLVALLPLPIITLFIAFWGYPSMPKVIPIHFGITGPDAWAPKSPAAVLQPIFSEIVISVLVLFTRQAPAAVKGSPNAAPGYGAYRKGLNGLLIVFALVIEIFTLFVEFSFVAPYSLSPAAVFRWGAPLLTTLLLAITVMMFLLFIQRVRRQRSAGPVLNDDSHWIWGMLYFNSSDPSLFVEKRVGIGFTINMARPAAWLILIAIIAVSVLFSVFNH